MLIFDWKQRIWLFGHINNRKSTIANRQSRRVPPPPRNSLKTGDFRLSGPEQN
jgi:hypothetical protein